MQGRRIVIATSNPGKIREIGALLADLPVTWVATSDLGDPPIVSETGTTFLENARLKAEAISHWAGLPALAEDSGLEVDALGGAPGVFSARYSGPGATDASNLALLLDRLRGVAREFRTARFRAVAIVAWGDGSEFDWAEGACEGSIAESPAGDSGFGYDPVFVPRSMDRTFAELGPEVKNRLSHRARALEALKSAILRRLGTADLRANANPCDA